MLHAGGCATPSTQRVAATTQPAQLVSEKLIGWMERPAAVPMGSLDPRKTLAFSPDGRQVAYVAPDSGMSLWLGGAKVATHARFGLPLVFSPDGQHLAYRAYDDARSDRSRIVIDSQTGPTYDATRGGRFSPDGRRFAYAARRDGKEMWVIDGQEQAAHDELIGDIAFSADGSRVRYLARDGKKSFLVDDGKPHEPFDYVVPPLATSADGKRVAYVAGYGPPPRERPARRIFSPFPDSKIRPFAVVDRQPEMPHGHVHSLTISPDGSRVAYATVDPGRRSRVLLDGQPLPLHRWVKEDSLVFSPDGKRLAYVAIDDGKTSVVVDGQRLTVDEVMTPPRFSADGRCFAFAGRRGSSQFVFIDGRPGPPLRADRPASLAFTPDGRHVVYCGRPLSPAASTSSQQPYALMLDDLMMARCGYIVGPIVFGADGRVTYIETRRHEDDSESFYRVERRLPPAAAPATTAAAAGSAPG